MNRLKVLRVVLVLVGLFFLAGVYPLVTSVRDGWRDNKEDATPMGLSVYVTLGVFLLAAARNPSTNRSVILYGGWANIAHAAVMTVMALHLPNERLGLLMASALFAVIGAALIALVPARELEQRTSTA
jgi:hypothetical protein